MRRQTPIQIPTPTVDELVAHALRRALDEFQCEAKFHQWLSQCPVCGGDLYVVEYTLVATGKRMVDHGAGMMSPSLLASDGFLVSGDDLDEDCSTEDEVVRCGTCRVTYDLTDLVLEDK